MDEEVCTEALIESIFLSGKQCFIPHFTKTNMKMVKLADLEDYKSLPFDRYGVRQPIDFMDRQDALETCGLDIVLSPGLGFSKCGLRIGRGMGYYDTFYEKYRAQWGAFPYTIGLAFSVQMMDEIPCTELDVPLNEIATYEPQN